MTKALADVIPERLDMLTERGAITSWRRFVNGFMLGWELTAPSGHFTIIYDEQALTLTEIMIALLPHEAEQNEAGLEAPRSVHVIGPTRAGM